MIFRELRFVALKLPKTEWGIPVYPDAKIEILDRGIPDTKYVLCLVGPTNPLPGEKSVRMIYKRYYMPECNTMLDWWVWIHSVSLALLKRPLYLEDFGETETIHI